MIEPSKKHLEDTNQSYTEHAVSALRLALVLLGLSGLAIAHAIVPGLAPTYTSSRLRELGGCTCGENCSCGGAK